MATAGLFAVTLFLFRTFSTHREDLAKRWSKRGQEALQAGKPDQAIIALRTALTYSPGTHDYELLLAEALGETGRPEESEESYQYFMTLWTAEPGNGPINLALARLARQRNQRQNAIDFYRAAVYGTWQGDGVVRRAAVRLELAQYLISLNDLEAARMELLIAGGNAPDEYARDMQIASLLEQAQDAGDAATYYKRAIAARPGDVQALSAAGRLAYKTGDFNGARRLLTRAQAARAQDHGKSENQQASSEQANDAAMLSNAQRILDLMPSPKISAKERARRVQVARSIAKARFAKCSSNLADNMPPDMLALDARWKGQDGTSRTSQMLEDSGLEDSAMQLVYDTETTTQKECGAPGGDDALLLRLANLARASNSNSDSSVQETHE